MEWREGEEEMKRGGAEERRVSFMDGNEKRGKGGRGGEEEERKAESCSLAVCLVAALCPSPLLRAKFPSTQKCVFV